MIPTANASLVVWINMFSARIPSKKNFAMKNRAFGKGFWPTWACFPPFCILRLLRPKRSSCLCPGLFCQANQEFHDDLRERKRSANRHAKNKNSDFILGFSFQDHSKQSTKSKPFLIKTVLFHFEGRSKKDSSST